MAEHSSGLVPTYFQPAQAPSASASVRLPTDVIDLFYLRGHPADTPVLVAVLRCLGGGLEVVAGDALADLPSDLQTLIRTAEVNQRSAFRVVTAQMLYAFGLNAMEQAGYAEGYNDAVFLQGRLHALAHMASNHLHITPLDVSGSLAVGRLDMLYGYRLGLQAVFHHPQSVGERVYHVMTPAESLEDIRRGRGLVLVYPVLDPATFASIDNSFIMLRIVYDLLANLQHDMEQKGDAHQFTTAVIPVPSRHRLEGELVSDGYVITGDTAVKHSSGDAQATSFLTRLRNLARQWSAPQIVLPPQATPQDYLALIDDIVPAVATDADRQMMQAMEERLSSLATAPDHAARRRDPEPTISNTAGPPTIPPPHPPYTGKTVPLLPIAPQPEPSRPAEWKQDFAASPRPPRRVRSRRPLPADDTLATNNASGNITSQDDWTADVLAELPPAATGVPQSDQDARTSWSGDFASPARPKASPEQPQNDWERDFD